MTKVSAQRFDQLPPTNTMGSFPYFLGDFDSGGHRTNAKRVSLLAFANFFNQLATLDNTLTNGATTTKGFAIGKATGLAPFSSMKVTVNADTSVRIDVSDTSGNNKVTIDPGHVGGPWLTVHGIGSTIKVSRIEGNSNAPTITPKAAAGSGGTAFGGGFWNDLSGEVTVTVGSSPATSDTVFTVIFSSPYGDVPNVFLLPANGAAAALYGTGAVWVDQAYVTTAGFKVLNSAALSASGVYKWWYFVIE